MSEELIKRLRYDCELALQLGDEARVVLPATDVRTIADTIEAQAAAIAEYRRQHCSAVEIARPLLDALEAQAAEIKRLKNILRDCDPESMSWLDARDAALGETE